MKGYVTIELSSGTYTGKPVGPHAWALVFGKHPVPARPMGTKTNDAGVEVEFNLPDDDPLMVDYVEELRTYNDVLREVGWLNFFAETLKVPEGWDMPVGHKRIGVELADDPSDQLIQYIRLDVILNDKDDLIVEGAIRGEITEEELAAPDRLFPGDEEQEAVTASA